MTMYDYYMNDIPDYYPEMYRNGFTPEQILMTKRREIQEAQEQELTDIKITSEVKV